MPNLPAPPISCGSIAVVGQRSSQPHCPGPHRHFVLERRPSHQRVRDQSGRSSDWETEGYGDDCEHWASGGAVGVLPEFNCFGARLSGLAETAVKESSMRVKKRVKRGVRKGIKRVKSAPPEAYVAGAGVLVGSAAVLLLTTTKSGRELLIHTAQLALGPQADEQESQESDVPEADEQESKEADARKEVDNEPAEDTDVEAEAEEDTTGEDETRVRDLKPRDQRPRSAAPGRRPRSPRKPSAPRKAANA